ncbi:TPA: endopeptidase La [Candidatus Dependentiae bacterium]|nr:endopeptidase La [Candidatus Dependentiae bacterium]HBZ73522.1 endopeptidase La [Candidatus Dependentiae bacterium]
MNDNAQKKAKFFSVLPLKNVVAMPKNVMPVIVGREVSIKAVEYALSKDKEIFVTSQKNFDTKVPTEKDIFYFGTRAIILQATKLSNGTLKILIEGVCRSKIAEIQKSEGFIGVLAEDVESIYPEKNSETEALWRTLRDLFKEYVELHGKIPAELLTMFEEFSDLEFLVDTIAAHLPLKLEDKQELLEMVDVKERSEKVISLVKHELEVIKTELKIKKRVQDQIEKHQKDYYLNEQIRAIQHELGRDNVQEELEQLRKKAKKLKLPKEAYDKVDAELKRLELMQPSSPEATVSRNYVDWILSIPWHEESKDTVSLEEAEKILEQSHAGMKKAKERILEFIAIKKFAKNNLKRSPIICLSGPPGVGKTTLAKSIAQALGREFIRISLGGMRDEAEIRGHRKTYIGAMPGKLIQSMKKAQTINPVILLDEVDKMSSDFRGDPSSALLEVLDTETNSTFADYFLEVDYDLSKVMFITTANVMDNIPYPLLDRMEIISLPGYTSSEKMKIVKEFLFPRVLKEHSLTAAQIEISDEIFRKIIDEYTKESGVRQLERVIAKLARKSIQDLLENKKLKKVKVDLDKIAKWLGTPKYKKSEKKLEETVGLATGLAWTEVGGEVLEIEVSILNGKGSLSLTGQLGEVMQESAQAALSYVRSRAKDFGLKPDFYASTDIHIHVPEGAIPKDGPSAGITITAALISALTKTPLQKDVAMTGEVTLRGRVLPVGGLKEKLLAAVRVGSKKAIVPKENQDEIKEFEKELNLDKDLNIIYADVMDVVIDNAFVRKPFLVEASKKAVKNSSKKTAKKKSKK